MPGDQNSVGASSNGPTPTPQSFASLTSNGNGVKSYLGTTGAAANNAMAASSFLPVQHRTPAIGSGLGTYPPALPKADSFDANGNGHATTPLGTPFSTTPPTLSAAVIRNLPNDTDEKLLRAMLVFSKDLASIEFLPDDKGFRAAHLKFKSPAGALEVKNNLDGKPNHSNDADIIVEIIGPTSPSAMGKRYPSDAVLPVGTPATVSGAPPTAPSSRQTSRFNGHFHTMEKTAVGNGAYNGDFRTADGRFGVFGPQSPIGTHPNERNGMLGKSMIDATNDDEDTAQLLGKTHLFAESGLQRRQTAPNIPLTSRMANMSLNINTNQAVQPISQYGNHQGYTTMSPSIMNPVGGFPVQQPFGRSSHMPPANPADQNPPCNTLYVGNLPVDTSEEELKALFCKQRGYKRLCFRTKQNGPMCFVEFENITFATKALNELYGFTLHNSVKGGIRLSFSKNPLGVRTGQVPGQNGQGALNGLNGGHVGANGFTTASGPPPGLTAQPPPGLGLNRAGFTSSPGVSNPYSSPTYSSPSTDIYDQWNNNLMYGNGNGAHMMGSNGNNGYPMGSTPNYPSHMMGR